MKNKNLFLIFIIFLIAFFFVEIKIYDKFLFLDEVRILNDTLKIKENNFSELFYPHRIFSIVLFNIFIKIFNNIYSLRIIGIFFSVMSIIIFYDILKLFFDEKKVF